jgi:hypothetical protein
MSIRTSKTKKRRASKSRTGDGAARVVDIISQLKTAARNPLAAVLGAAIGGIVPWFAREIAHGELAPAVSSGDYRMAAIDLAIVLGCVAFSMVTVYGFGRAAVGDPRKAVGFCLALEGVMLVAHGRPATVALVALVLINAVTTGCTIAMARSATQKRSEADDRRSATRAGNRAARAAVTPVAATENEPIASTPGSAPIRATARRNRPAQRAVVVSSTLGASWDRARDGAIDAECVEIN